MRARFVATVAMRYTKPRRRSSGFVSAVLSVAGVAAGVMTLTAVLGVMNGLQLGFIEDIVEISSYHLQIHAPEGLSEGELAALKGIDGVEAVVRFGESQVILDGGMSGSRASVFRVVDQDVLVTDPGLREHLAIISGAFALDEPGGVVLGAELARMLSVRVGSLVSVLSISGGAGSPLVPVWDQLQVVGLFRSGYYQFDVGLGFVSFETARRLFGESPRGVYGVKLVDRFRDRRVGAEVERRIPNIEVQSWRDFNRAFFSALLLEKVLMFLIPGLIFVVVAFNIFHSLRRSVFERREDIAVLRAMGASGADIRGVFVVQGGVIGTLGSILGVFAGLLVATNANELFRLTEDVVNAGIRIVEVALRPILDHSSEAFSIFSPMFFYLSEVPSRVLLPETIGIVIAGVLSATLSAYFASSRIADVDPAAVLRYE